MKNRINLAKLTLFVALVLGLAACTGDKTLPYYGQRDTKEVKQADGTMRVDTIYQTIAPFQLLNQDSVLIDQTYFKDKIYIADFFFTSCSTICPIMHRNLLSIFNEFKDEKDLAYLSHTIDFKYDKPSVLKKYATKLGVDGPKWQFVFGSKADIYKLAEKSYLVAVGEDSTARDGYIHQGYLVLVDKENHIRGAYDGTDSLQVNLLKKDLKTLIRSYNK